MRTVRTATAVLTAVLALAAAGCDRVPDSRVITIPGDAATAEVERDPDPEAFCEALDDMNASFAVMEASAGDAAALEAEVDDLLAAITEARTTAPEDLQRVIDEAAPVYIEASQQAADGVDYRETLNDHWKANDADFQAIQAFAQENGCF